MKKRYVKWDRVGLGIQGVSKVRSDCILYFAQSIYCFFRQMYTDSGKKFIQITFQNNFKLQFEEIIISLKFCPTCARTRGFFSRYFCYPFCRFSIFVFFAAFFYFLYTVCATGLQSSSICFYGLLAIRSKKLANCRRGMNDLSEQVVKSKDLRRQTQDWVPLLFYNKCVRNVIKKAVKVFVIILQDRKVKEFNLQSQCFEHNSMKIYDQKRLESLEVKKAAHMRTWFQMDLQTLSQRATGWQTHVM